MKKKYNVIERFKLEKIIKKKKEEGKSIQIITDDCNQMIPSEEVITKRNVEYFLSKLKLEIGEENVNQESLLTKLNRIEDEVWDLIDEAKLLKDVAKNQLNDDPILFDRSLRTLNSILGTSLNLIKEMKIPAESLHVDSRKESLSILLDFSSDLDPDIKRILIENINKYLEK